jgi:NADPH2:quinone reductase
MRAVVLQGPGPDEALDLTAVPVPNVAVGSVLIRVHAFGLNRSELHLGQGVATKRHLPRIPGIEAAGVVARPPGGELVEGTPGRHDDGRHGRSRVSDRKGTGYGHERRRGTT